MNNQTQIRPLIREGIAVISEAFNEIGWNKPPSLFEEYLMEQEVGERVVWVAHFQGKFAGYVTLKWQSEYPLFKTQSIPEIMDLNVLTSFRKMGVGSLLLDTAEKEAAARNAVVGIGIGLCRRRWWLWISSRTLYKARLYPKWSRCYLQLPANHSRK